MSKILVVGKTRRLETSEEERLWKALEVSPSLFQVPTMETTPANVKSMSVEDALYISRLRAAFTKTQDAFYTVVRDAIFASDSWRSGCRTGRTVAERLVFPSKVSMPDWITSSLYRQEGRTFLLAVAYIEKALIHQGSRLRLEDHAGEMADEVLDSQVKDLVEVDDSIRKRSSFANRGELVIFSEEHLKSVIAP
jgi:hypothetical protein